MKLYYAPGACSLAQHIAIREGGLDVKLDKITFGEKRTTEEGRDFYSINPMGAVPALELDDGSVLTENAVLLQYLAEKAPQIGVAGNGMAHWRFLETLNFIATELHKSFSPLFRNPPPDARAAAIKHILNRFALLEGKLGDKPYLMGDTFTGADAYAYVMFSWSKKFEIDLSSLPKLSAYFARVRARPGVQQALTEEGLPTS
jgi:glutathione S-transferase